MQPPLGFWFVPGGLGASRIPRKQCPPEHLETRAQEMLSRALNLRTLLVFIGSGCSKPLGHPLWDALSQEAIAFATALSDDRRAVLRDAAAYPKGAARAAFVLGEVVRAGLDARARIIQRFFRGRGRAAHKIHESLLKLRVSRFATTNYDTEIEYALARLESINIGRHRSARSFESALSWRLTRDHQLVDWPMRAHTRAIATYAQRSALVGDRTANHVTFVCADRSFTQMPFNARQLAEFVVTRPRRDEMTMVFHLHGRCDDVDSVVLSESDYQYWYLNDSGEGTRAYRQTIELLLGSNPILFVGYGMSDPDLLRTLRALGTTDPRRKDARAVFVLLHRAADFAAGKSSAEQRGVYQDFLYDLYGVNVLWFGSARSAAGITDELVNELTALADRRVRWQEAWLQKPKPRTPPASVVPTPVPHYGHNLPGTRPKRNLIAGSGDLGEARSYEGLLQLCDTLARDCRPKRIVLCGPGGAGKSHRAVHLFWLVARRIKSPPIVSVPHYECVFFWSSYYSDDWQSGVDQAVAFLQDPKATVPKTRRSLAGDRIALLRALLRKRHALLIFDGFERLLGPTAQANVGRAYNANVRRFLQAIQDDRSNSSVVLTSRLWPEECGPAEESLANGTLQPVKALAANIVGKGSFKNATSEQVGAICSLLDGHAYGLRLAQGYVRVSPERWGEAVRALSRTPPHQRISRMVGLVIDDYERAAAKPDLNGSLLARGFLERTAMFMSPVDTRILDVCYERAATAASRKNGGLLAKNLRERLVELNLLIPVTTTDTGRATRRWTLHPVVRGYVFHRMHGAIGESLPNFTLPGFTSGTAAVEPGSPRAGDIAKDMLDALMGKSWAARLRLEEATVLWRAAFSVMRARMEAITAPRWIAYDEYIRYSVRMINLAKALSSGTKRPGTWSYADSPTVARFDVYKVNGVLYAEELAWLYNDLGLALCCEGSMHDAFSVWEQGYEVNRIIEGRDEPGQLVVQSLLHLSHTMLELGNIYAADEYLEKTRSANARLDNNEDFGARILGYQGLLAHLRGNLQQATTCLNECVSQLTRARSNTRAEAIFLRYRADLLIRLEQYEEAAGDIRVSRSLAQTAGDPDLVAYARKSLGHLLRAQRKFGRAHDEYEAAQKEAQRMGIRRLEADVLSELSHLALDLRDAESARLKALQAMRIANELGLGLRQCHGLVVLGRASIMAGQRDLGIGYLQTAYKLSLRSGYWLRANDAEERLREVGVEVRSPD